MIESAESESIKSDSRNLVTSEQQGPEIEEVFDGNNNGDFFDENQESILITSWRQD